MDKARLKKYFKLFVKLLFTVVAIYFVLREIDLAQARQLLVHLQVGWFLLALGLFNLSKIASAFRLNKYFQAIPVEITKILNLKLYYIGMFYNLFLPGSIGGDGYKVYLINRLYKTKVKDLISASVLDRISGVAALAFLAGVLLVFTEHPTFFPQFNLAVGTATVLVLPGFYLFCFLLFRKFIGQFWITTYYSFLVQGLQVVCAVCLLQALGVSQHYVEYLALFLISSVVSVLPITVGGVGARELVFLLGYQYLPIDKTVAVSFSLLFFGITAISSLVGVAFTVTPETQSRNLQLIET